MSRPKHRSARFWKPRTVVGGLLGPLVLLGVFPAPANAYPRPGTAERISVASDGTRANFISENASISADGRYVTFQSLASNLVPGDVNNFGDVFVHDRAAGVTELVSVTSGGVQADATSYNPSISADGRYVAFESDALTLVPGITNDVRDVFVHDRVTGTTERVSVASDGAEANGASGEPSISADGRHVVFQSLAPNLVPSDTDACIAFSGPTTCMDVFVHDREAGTTERVSVASDGTEGNGASQQPSISADGRFVAFGSSASNLVSADTNAVADVFVHDREAGTTERVSVASDGAEANGASGEPSISADGRHVVFQSLAPNLVSADTNRGADVFVHDREAGTTERVSVASDGTEGNGASRQPSISADGRFVAFNHRVRDRDTGTTEPVPVGVPDGSADFGTQAISADGRYIAFGYRPSGETPPGGSYSHVFVRDRGGALGVLGDPSVLKTSSGLEVSGWATFSGQEVTSAADPDDDAAGPLGRELGAELTGASLTYRPEQEDLLLRLRLASLPPVAGGSPGITYGLALRAGETRFEVRALRAGATSVPPAAPYVAVHRCAPSCVEETLLTGALGSTGEEVTASIPPAALDAFEGAALSELRAFTAVGEAALGEVESLDEVALPDAAIPASGVELGIAPASTTEDEVGFTVGAELLEGGFSGTIPTASHPPGSYRVWARACLGEVCGPAASKGVTL